MSAWRGPKRPGQWTDKTRAKRHKRRARAWCRCCTEWGIRARGEGKRPNRAKRRGWRRQHIEEIAVERGLLLRSSELTRDLESRIRLSTRPRTFGLTKADLEAMSGGKVEVDSTTGTIRITMPAASTSAERDEVEERLVPLIPVSLVLEVVPAP